MERLLRAYSPLADEGFAMASIRDLVVHVNDDVMSRHAFELASSLAADLGARLMAVLVAAPVNAGVGLSAETASLAQQLAQAQRTTLLGIGDRLAAGARQRHGLAVDVRCVDGDPVEVLQYHARAADLLITSQRDPAREGGLSTGQSARLLVGAACPVLTVPYVGLLAPEAVFGEAAPLRRALVAWADTRESARAVRDALPLLARASHVELVSFAKDGQSGGSSQRAALERVVTYLARHGVQALPTLLSQAEASLGERMRRGGVPDVAVAEALLSHAADMHADFFVMGGYGHSRLWELVLGGVTRTMLETMTVPVLMSH
ncbi:MAG TPA: universal stress protein [Piscinibacter sp.]|nr:universal stress protein [Piscinibacter sp.]HPM68998.1 universal stress protein [Piscinibacter sp.]